MIVLAVCASALFGLFGWALLRSAADADRRMDEMVQRERAKRKHPSNYHLRAVRDDD